MGGNSSRCTDESRERLLEKSVQSKEGENDDKETTPSLPYDNVKIISDSDTKERATLGRLMMLSKSFCVVLIEIN